MEQEHSDKLLLGYWACRGRGQSVRYFLEYLRLPYEEKRYGENWQEWFEQDKPNLKAPFPNLPYLKDGEKVITQSETIYLYLIRKAGRKDLLGKTEDEQLEVSSCRWTVQDLWNGVVDLAYSPDFEKRRDEDLRENAEVKLAQLSKFLGEKEFLHGYLTYVDFIFVEVLETLSVMKGELEEKYANLGQYRKRFLEQQFMKDYLASSKYIRRPFFGPAVWNPMD